MSERIGIGISISIALGGAEDTFFDQVGKSTDRKHMALRACIYLRQHGVLCMYYLDAINKAVQDISSEADYVASN
jgi:hypothetical protein